MTKTLPFFLLIALMGCTQQDFFPNADTTTVDGDIYVVRQTQPGTFQAMPNEAPGKALFVNDATIWANNVKAIEQVTKCKVAAGSVSNDFTITIAAVDCDG